jgi:hypothetical protein
MLDADIDGAGDVPTQTETRSTTSDAAKLATRLVALLGKPHGALRAEWRRLYRSEPPKSVSRDLLELGIAWKLQEKALGGMSAALKRRTTDLAKTMETRGDLARARAVTLKPGARLMREWRGETHDVRVLEEGFEWRGARWRSLSAIAREITGTQWSGPRFFGLEKTERMADGRAAATTATTAATATGAVDAGKMGEAADA